MPDGFGQSVRALSFVAEKKQHHRSPGELAGTRSKDLDHLTMEYDRRRKLTECCKAPRTIGTQRGSKCARARRRLEPIKPSASKVN